MKRFFAFFLALTLTTGLLLNSPVVVKADNALQNAVEFASDDNSVTIRMIQSSGSGDYTHTFSDDEKALIDAWGDFNYTFVSTSYYQYQTNGYYWLIIYPKDAELRVFNGTNNYYAFLEGSVFEKESTTAVQCIHICIDDLGNYGWPDESDVEVTIIDPATKTTFLVGRYNDKNMTDEEFNDFFSGVMLTSADVKLYNERTLEVGNFFCVANVTNHQVQPDDSQSVEIRANVVSIYSVSLPASIDLAYDVLENVWVGDADEMATSAEGYFGKIVFGCAGKISSNQYVFITPSFPCTLTSKISNETVELKKILPSDKSESKTKWTNGEIGSCEFDGTSLTNCQYSYNEGLYVGFLLKDISSNGTFSGSLVFNFGIR